MSVVHGVFSYVRNRPSAVVYSILHLQSLSEDLGGEAVKEKWGAETWRDLTALDRHHPQGSVQDPQLGRM